MNPHLLVLAKLLMTVGISLAVLRVLSRPLVDVLERICPDTQAANFWLSYTRLMLIIAPALLVLTVDLVTRFGDPLDSLRVALMASLAGLLLGLQAIGKRIGGFVVMPKRIGGEA
jgi:hypothetical protein